MDSAQKRVHSFVPPLTLVIEIPTKSISVVLCSSGVRSEENASQIPSVIFKPVRGRLGNHMWGYMHRLALHLNYGVTALISQESKDILEEYFKHIDFPVMERDVCGAAEYYQSFLEFLDSKIMTFYEEKSGQRIEWTRDRTGRLVIPGAWHEKWPLKTREMIRSEGFLEEFQKVSVRSVPGCQFTYEVFGGPYALLSQPEWKFNRALLSNPSDIGIDDEHELYKIEGLASKLAEHFTFKDTYVAEAQATLQSVLEKFVQHKKKKQLRQMWKKGGPVFVGIHCRRTDHIEYQLKIHLVPLRTQYYLDAMHLFRTKYPGRVIFVFVSDDLNWGRDKLLVRNKERDLFIAGNGNTTDPRAVGSDLALLAQCNHTIQSHGSFSYFAGFLAGGIKIVPEHFEEYSSPVHDKGKLVKRNPFEDPLPRLYFFSSL